MAGTTFPTSVDTIANFLPQGANGQQQQQFSTNVAGAVIALENYALAGPRTIGPFRVNWNTPGVQDGYVALADLDALASVIRVWGVQVTLWELTPDDGTIAVDVNVRNGGGSVDDPVYSLAAMTLTPNYWLELAGTTPGPTIKVARIPNENGWQLVAYIYGTATGVPSAGAFDFYALIG